MSLRTPQALNPAHLLISAHSIKQTASRPSTPECQRSVVLVDDVCGNLLIDYLVKQCGSATVSMPAVVKRHFLDKLTDAMREVT